jgi:hypothetical protein
MYQEVHLAPVWCCRRSSEDVRCRKDPVKIGLDPLTEDLSFEEVVVEGAADMSIRICMKYVNAECLLGCESMSAEENATLDLVTEASGASIGIDVCCFASIHARW